MFVGLILFKIVVISKLQETKLRQSFPLPLQILQNNRKQNSFPIKAFFFFIIDFVFNHTINTTSLRRKNEQLWKLVCRHKRNFHDVTYHDFARAVRDKVQVTQHVKRKCFDKFYNSDGK